MTIGARVYLWAFNPDTLIYILFLFLILLLELGLPTQYWIKVMRVVILILGVGLSYRAIIILRNVPSAPTFFQGVYCKRMLNFVNSLFCAYWDDHVFFNLLMWWLICWHWTILAGCLILLIYCWIQFNNILFRSFASMWIGDIGL